MTFKERLKMILSPHKIHKLKLTNGFGTLLVSFFKIVFGRLERGERTRGLEEAFRSRFGARKAVVFPHARIAFHFILKSMGLKEGDEVLMPPLTIADMVNSVHVLGLRPVFVDIELDTLCMDPEKLEMSITPRSKVILLTYLNGIVPDVERIRRVARKYNLKIVEDISQCFEGTYDGQKVGTFGEAAFLSLTNFKVCSSLFGGMVITNDEDMAKKLEEFRNEEILPPRKPMLLKLLVKDLIYSVLFSKWVFSYFTYFVVLALEKINPEITYRLYSGNIRTLLGMNVSELYASFPDDYLTDYTDAQANIGLESLKKAGDITHCRMKNGELLRKSLSSLAGVGIPVKIEKSTNVYWRFPVISKDRNGLKAFLLKNGIDSAPTYLALCSNETAFAPYRRETPNAEEFKKNALIVEVNEDLRECDMARTALLIHSHFLGRKEKNG